MYFVQNKKSSASNTLVSTLALALSYWLKSRWIPHFENEFTLKVVGHTLI